MWNTFDMQEKCIAGNTLPGCKCVPFPLEIGTLYTEIECLNNISVEMIRN